jgi:cyclic pyranopterin phosphate synthase
MPFDGNRWNSQKMVSYAEMVSRIKELYPDFIRSACAEDPVGQTSKVYHVPGFKGTVGFISSMSNHFCHSCNRLRLTADGKLKVCLFGAAETDLKSILRDQSLPTPERQSALESLIQKAVLSKKKQHAGMHEIWKSAASNRPMIRIGG